MFIFKDVDGKSKQRGMLYKREPGMVGTGADDAAEHGP